MQFFPSARFRKQSKHVSRAVAETLEPRRLFAATLSAAPKIVTATEGQTINPVIASFSCSDTKLGAASFFADVDWGNGSHSTGGTIVALGGGKFNVTGGHRYDAHGSFNLDVFIHIKNGFATTAHSKANIADAALNVQGTKFTINGGQANPVVVATFTDPFPDSPGATAQIDWGDGAAKSAGTITPIAGSPGQFRVGGSHIYASTSAFPVTVTINNHGQNFVAKSTATVLHVYTDIIAVPGDSVSLDSATPGAEYTIPVSVLNNGNFTLHSISFVDTLPAGFVDVQFEPSTGTYNSTTHVWSGFDLAAGDDMGMNLNGTIDAAAAGSLVNTAVVGTLGGIVDTNLVNNTTTRTIQLPPKADLAIDNVGDDDPPPPSGVVPGTQYTYTIAVTNNGPSDVKGATVADTFPDAVSSDSWTAVATGTSGAKFTDSGTGDINESVDLPSGATITYTVKADIAADATGKLDDTATVTAPNTVTDTNPANNSSTESLSLTPMADLSITNVANRDGLYGSTVTFTVTVTNNGPSDALNVAATDAQPAGLSFSSASPDTGSYSNQTGIWSIGKLVSGHNAKLDLTYFVYDSGLSSTTNSASVKSDTTDSNAANNSADKIIKITYGI